MDDARPGSLASQVLAASGGSVALLAFARYCLHSTNCSLKSKVQSPGGQIRVTVGAVDASTETNSEETTDDLDKESSVTVVIKQC